MYVHLGIFVWICWVLIYGLALFFKCKSPVCQSPIIILNLWKILGPYRLHLRQKTHHNVVRMTTLCCAVWFLLTYIELNGMELGDLCEYKDSKILYGGTFNYYAIVSLVIKCNSDLQVKCFYF